MTIHSLEDAPPKTQPVPRHAGALSNYLYRSASRVLKFRPELGLFAGLLPGIAALDQSCARAAAARRPGQRGRLARAPLGPPTECGRAADKCPLAAVPPHGRTAICGNPDPVACCGLRWCQWVNDRSARTRHPRLRTTLTRASQRETTDAGSGRPAPPMAPLLASQAPARWVSVCRVRSGSSASPPACHPGVRSGRHRSVYRKPPGRARSRRKS